MPRLSRRLFLGWLGGLLAAFGIARRRADARSGRTSVGSTPAQQPRLEAAHIQAIAEAVLPSALGPGGMAVAATAFRRWIDAYRPGAELVHGYGTGDIRFAGPSPAPRWQQQLTELDAAAHRAHGAPFARLAVAERQAVLREALPASLPARMPSPLAAPHVAIALLAHFYESADATDLCYERQIGKNKCRPLVHSSREPLPLASTAPSPGRVR